jgi:hypothetical protein
MTEMTDEQVADLAGRIRDLRDRAAELKNKADDLTGQLREALKVGTNQTYGPWNVHITQSTTFSEARALELSRAGIITAEQIEWATITVKTVDEARLTDILPPTVAAQCRVPRGKATVTIS